MCKENTLGFLSGGGHSIVWRCSTCRYDEKEPLPPTDKKILYLDQFAFSELFKLKSGSRREDKLTEFWQEVDVLIHRVVHLQAAVFPHCNIHHGETVVSPWPKELREAYEEIGGDMRLEDTGEVQLREITEFAQAFIEGRDPTMKFDVDDILRGNRNEWLPNIRVVVNVNYDQFADGTRKRREKTGNSVNNLMQAWRERDLGFDEVLEIELGAYSDSRIGALNDYRQKYSRAEAEGDVMEMLNLDMSPISRELAMLGRLFERVGIPEPNHAAVRDQFWQWNRNREMPFGRLLAYMFAALAGQVKAGRKKGVSSGFMNDVEAIAAYAPFVDAMFIDKECASLLTQGRAGRELTYRSRIFSLSNRTEFLDYLRELNADATEETKRYARIIYGLD
ncbi:hypothetical protein AOA14_06275 [Sphingopyxis terrae subsp. terrae NBRC 15098]|uniref:Uncharacterized protein n=1 Tax=Sphingopyxis terrae subsp. terrae NBRC 15098 TaxID=1219058 RepID=A0A142VWV8_9SPHN|nr:hypothetical protein [Sphingopyxis terrae]AMU94211.1 hypothetical protein AOA14_06275 [Sphingopyxis terrae subsp. terrae NBRC 15098]